MANLEEMKSKIKISEIPSLSPVLDKVIKLTDKPNVAPQEIAKVMTLDPSLTTKVLSIVNSARYNLPRKVSNVVQAITLLGIKTIKNLALTASVYSKMKDKDNLKFYNAIWKHSLDVGFTAEYLSRQFLIGTPEDAFTYGIMHDLGKILEIKFFFNDFMTIKENAAIQKTSFIVQEKAHFELTHAELVEVLFEKWNIPLFTRIIIKGHHDFLSVDPNYRTSAALLHFSDYIVNTIQPENSFNYGKPTLQTATYSKLNINKSSLDDIIDGVKELLEKVDDFFSKIK